MPDLTPWTPNAGRRKWSPRMCTDLHRSAMSHTQTLRHTDTQTHILAHTIKTQKSKNNDRLT